MLFSIDSGLYNIPKGFISVLNLQPMSLFPIFSLKQEPSSSNLSVYEIVTSFWGVSMMVRKFIADDMLQCKFE